MRTTKKYLFTIIWIVVMCYLLFSPSGSLPKSGLFHIPHFDKIVHWGMFGILTLVFMYDAHKNLLSKKNTLIILLVFSTFFAVFSELIQYRFITGRQGSFLDFLADITGVVMGVIFVVLLKRFVLKHR